jgi:hypothetical protein
LIAIAPLTIGTKQNHHGAFATIVNFRRNRGEASLEQSFRDAPSELGFT